MDKKNRKLSKDSNVSIYSIELTPRVSEFRRICKVLFGRKIVIIGFAIIAILILTAIFANYLAPYDPYKIDLDSQLLQPGKAHLLGTDNIGRDTLSRVIYGTRISLMVGIISVSIAAILGITLGLIAGYFGGFTFIIIMRIMDAMMSFPIILFALVVVALLGGGLQNILITLGIGLIPGYTRLICGQTLTIKENDYVVASRAIGATNKQILLRHILPNCFPPLIVMMSMTLGMAILAEASLSFLGVGVKPPAAAWGSMVSNGYNYLLTNPVLSLAPGIAIMLVVFSFNMVGDGLRDALDPRLRGVL